MNKESISQSIKFGLNTQDELADISDLTQYLIDEYYTDQYGNVEWKEVEVKDGDNVVYISVIKWWDHCRNVAKFMLGSPATKYQAWKLIDAKITVVSA